MRLVVWISAIIVLAMAVFGLVLPAINILQAYTLFGWGDPQTTASALSEIIIQTAIAAPIWLAHVIVAVWTLKQLKKKT